MSLREPSTEPDARDEVDWAGRVLSMREMSRLTFDGTPNGGRADTLESPNRRARFLDGG